jgi:hypothetical protein
MAEQTDRGGDAKAGFETQGQTDARDIHRWCQQEGGRFLRYSRLEILEMLDNNTLNDDLQELCYRRSASPPVAHTGQS